MMTKKIVFLINAAHNQRCIKRVEEFQRKGFEIEAYAISRKTTIRNDSVGFNMNIIAEFNNTLSYRKRLGIIYHALKKVFDKHKKEDVVYYYFGLDIAMIATSICHNKKYIYEESDLQHTMISNKLVMKLFDKWDKKIIRNSWLTVFTSEGFVRYHFGKNVPSNVTVVANRLNTSITKLPTIDKTPFDSSKIRFGFVGAVRYETIASIAELISGYNKNFEFHFYGAVGEEDEHLFTHLQDTSNIFWHGLFLNPRDLPEIYSKIDIVVSTYDTKFENVRYAEPNKIYESIYFRTPIIVSRGTFLADKVREMGIGYEVDPFSKEDVDKLLDLISTKGIEDKIATLNSIDKTTALNINDAFFDKLKKLI